MKLVNNNISPLPFYDNIELQNHRKDYAFGQVYPLITYKNMLLPFQFITDSSVKAFAYIRLYDFNNPSSYIDIKQDMLDAGLKVIEYDGFQLWKYPGLFPLPSIKQEGRFYIGILTNTGNWLYSEVFTVTNRVDDYLLLEYYNSYNLQLSAGVVDFSEGFKFKCYLNTQVGKPEYNFEEEATERMGYSFIESQVSKKVYKFTFVAPEYLCDALRIVRLCENKQITSKLQTYDLTSFSMSTEWEEQGDLAAVNCEFETDTVIANIGSYVPAPKGDFNADFNADYDIS